MVVSPCRVKVEEYHIFYVAGVNLSEILSLSQGMLSLVIY